MADYSVLLTSPISLQGEVDIDGPAWQVASEVLLGIGVYLPLPVDDVDPVVDNFSPAVGSQILSTESVSFDVTDDSGSFARIIVVAWFKVTGVQELVHDGDAFTGYYQSSSRVPISNGFRYTVTRRGGWGSSPTFRVFPIDSKGNEP